MFTSQSRVVKHGTLLCLDVHPAVVEAISRPVIDAGYEVVRETRATAGDKIAAAAVVLADLRAPGPALPGLDGRILVALLAKETPVPVGAVEILVDPGDPDEILAAVDRGLARHRLAAVTESLQAPIKLLVEAVREAEATYDSGGASAARPHLERIRDALADLERRVDAIDDD